MVEREDTCLHTTEELEEILAEAGSEEEQRRILEQEVTNTFAVMLDRSKEIFFPSTETRTEPGYYFLTGFEKDVVGYMQTKLRELGSNRFARVMRLCFGETKRLEVQMEAVAIPHEGAESLKKYTFETAVYLPVSRVSEYLEIVGAPNVGLNLILRDDVTAVCNAAIAHAIKKVELAEDMSIHPPISAVVKDGDEIIYEIYDSTVIREEPSRGYDQDN